MTASSGFIHSVDSVASQNRPANVGEARDTGSIPRSERFPGVGHGIFLQYFCLENSMNRGTWWATAHGIAKEWDIT